MGTWDRILAALRREKRDVAEAVDEWKDKASAALDQRERELKASPSEKLAMEEQRGSEIDAELDAVRKRIERGDTNA
ncbi:MAG TPA: hypothetical protein VF230_02125 [Acidimicrobiales bacterium]